MLGGFAYPRYITYALTGLPTFLYNSPLIGLFLLMFLVLVNMNFALFRSCTIFLLVFTLLSPFYANVMKFFLCCTLLFLAPLWNLLSFCTGLSLLLLLIIHEDLYTHAHTDTHKHIHTYNSLIKFYKE